MSFHNNDGWMYVCVSDNGRLFASTGHEQYNLFSQPQEDGYRYIAVGEYGFRRNVSNGALPAHFKKVFQFSNN